MRLLLFLVLIFVFAGSCYKPRFGMGKGIPPTFKLLAFSAETTTKSLEDSVCTFPFKVSASANWLSVTCILTSGDPTDYPVVVYVAELPPGFSVAEDTATVYLSAGASFNFDVTALPGSYDAAIAIFTNDKGVERYPVIFKVEP